MDLNPSSGRNTGEVVVFLQQDCSAPWPVEPGTLDTVFTSNFFEHLPTKSLLEDTLRQAWKSLKPGGRLIAMGPNIKYVPGAYWDFFDHYLALTELSLGEVLEKCGFEIERSDARFLPYTMSQGTEYPLWTLKLYLAMPFVWPLFGKQFLVVARKR
jgi:SAM-dependent methyltransferase